MIFKNLGRRAAVATAALALAMPSAAMAQGPVTDTYGGSPEVLNQVSGSDDVTREAGSGGSLPFTGLDLGLLIGGGLTMLGFGVVLRRVSRTTV